MSPSSLLYLLSMFDNKIFSLLSSFFLFCRRVLRLVKIYTIFLLMLFFFCSFLFVTFVVLLDCRVTRISRHKHLDSSASALTNDDTNAQQSPNAYNSHTCRFFRANINSLWQPAIRWLGRGLNGGETHHLISVHIQLTQKVTYIYFILICVFSSLFVSCLCESEAKRRRRKESSASERARTHTRIAYRNRSQHV